MGIKVRVESLEDGVRVAEFALGTLTAVREAIEAAHYQRPVSWDRFIVLLETATEGVAELANFLTGLKVSDGGANIEAVERALREAEEEEEEITLADIDAVLDEAEAQKDVEP